MKRNILLNPGPGTTSDSVKMAQVVPDICPREKEFADLLAGVRNDLVRVVKADTEKYVAVAFAASGTGGVEAAITSAVPRDKKLLVVENGAYGTRIMKMAARFGIETNVYSLAYGDYPDVDEIERRIIANPEISHVAIIHHETTTGMLNPVRETIEVAHRHGVEVIVDSMSGYAAIPIDANEWEIDYLVSTSNKCIQGMAGLTFVIMRRDLLPKIKDNARSFYFDVYAQSEGFNRSGQMQYTPPVQIIYALRQALDEFFEEGIENRNKRYTENWQTLYDGLKEIGFRFLLPYKYESKILMAIREPKDENFSFQTMHDYLYDRGFTIYPGKGAKEATFRLAVIGQLHKQDMKDFLIALKNYVQENHITKF